MLSTLAPVLIVFIIIVASFELASGYGIAIAAVGMLSTLGVTLATDSFGPVADNAGISLSFHQLVFWHFFRLFFGEIRDVS
jgi:Na+/H+-translocating membrane pyrophosphatase